MPVYDVRGISVHFPHEAYQSQIDFMDKMIGALQEEENALLESPTGTGKTLCLLSAALAWRNVYVAKNQLSEIATSTPGFQAYMENAEVPLGQRNLALSNELLSSAQHLTGSGSSAEKQAFGKRTIPLIVYASRTHSQLSQVVTELRNLVYRPKVAVIGSRDQMCINPDVRATGAANTALQAVCSQLVKRKGCSYYGKVGEAQQTLTSICSGSSGKVFDIEDIVKFGQNHKACPYYLSREGFEDADVLFMPYNYVVDRKARSFSMDLENAVIIFDEAHNLESVCGDASSFDINTDELNAALKEANSLLTMIEGPEYFGILQPNDVTIVQSTRNNALF